MKELSSRERVLRSVCGGDIDRTPRLFRADASVAGSVMQKKGFGDMEALYGHYGIDTKHIGVAYNTIKPKPCDIEGCYFDMFGNLHRVSTNGKYATDAIVEPAFANVHDVEYIQDFPFPAEGYVDIEESKKAAEAAHSSGRAVVGGVWASLFTMSRSLMGEERFLCSLYDEPELIEALVSRITDMYMDWNEQYLKACGEYIDIYYFGSDFGTQGSMFLSEEHYVRFFLGNMRRIVEGAKKHVDTVMFHTCGAVDELIPHLIDIGVDILDPVQTGANGMQPERLAKKYKGKICFHGAVSTQSVLPFGTPGDVVAHVKDIIGTLGPTGLVLGPDQDMIGDIPVENVDAMYDMKAKEQKKYA